MKLINLNKLTAQSGVMAVLRTGAQIRFCGHKDAVLLIAYNRERNLCLRVDWWRGTDVFMEEFTLDHYGLEKALKFIERL